MQPALLDLADETISVLYAINLFAESERYIEMLIVNKNHVQRKSEIDFGGTTIFNAGGTETVLGLLRITKNLHNTVLHHPHCVLQRSLRVCTGPVEHIS